VTRFVKTLEPILAYDQKTLEVPTPLVQNGAYEHGPDRGDIAVEWAHFGRLNRIELSRSAAVVWLVRTPSFPRWKEGGMANDSPP
jgi:hypothetical protein